MVSTIIKELRPALVLLATLTLVTGVVYPWTVTGIAQVAFPRAANGSLVERDGQVLGSELIAQSFSSPRYFWPRPSACGYNAAASSGSNRAPSNPALVDAVKERIAALRASDPTQEAPIPIDLVTTSGSGLDPHISVEAALWQAPRVGRERSLSLAEVKGIVKRHTEEPMLGLIGRRRVNVLGLNLALDAEAPSQ